MEEHCMPVNWGRLERLEDRVNTLYRPPNPNLPTKAELKDFLTFIKYFYRLETGRDFEISQPICRRSHQLILADLVPEIINHEINRLMINMPPRYGKTEWAKHLIAYGLAYYPDSQYLYISYSAELAIRQTSYIKSIIELPQYGEIFGVFLDYNNKAKHDFMTRQGGRVIGAGAGGTIVGNGAGIKYGKRFGGFIILDDMHKPAESHSQSIRDHLKSWFKNTLYTRLNDPSTPLIYIGHITHEDDIPMNLRQGRLDPLPWKCVILPGMDEAKNALDPVMHSVKTHDSMRIEMPYEWWAQYQQEPQPAGGSIFPQAAFQILEERPSNILVTYITVDTAETSKNFSDKSVFSFWGLYKIKQNDKETQTWGLHWLNCQELKIEVKDLEQAFLDFYFSCCQYHIPPSVIGIEKKSTGSTLIAALSDLRDVKVVNTIEHRESIKRIDEIKEEIIKSANKITRFIACQPFVCRKRVTFDSSSKHTNMCIEHLAKITANDSHLHDDIADTLSDAIFMIPFMEKQIKHAVSEVHIPGYKAIPEYRKKRTYSWH
jgi:hypothetical protein